MLVRVKRGAVDDDIGFFEKTEKRFNIGLVAVAYSDCDGGREVTYYFDDENGNVGEVMKKFLIRNGYATETCYDIKCTQRDANPK